MKRLALCCSIVVLRALSKPYYMVVQVVVTVNNCLSIEGGIDNAFGGERYIPQ